MNDLHSLIGTTPSTCIAVFDGAFSFYSSTTTSMEPRRIIAAKLRGFEKKSQIKIRRKNKTKTKRDDGEALRLCVYTRTAILN